MTEIADPTPDEAEGLASEAPARPRVHFGAAVRPSVAQRAALRAAVEPEVKAPSLERFHRESSLVPTVVASRPDPMVRAHSDVRRVVTVLSEPVYAIADEVEDA